jgi:DNA-binding LytR/AlgR family response regulator
MRIYLIVQGVKAMPWITICDDEAIFLSQVKECVQEYNHVLASSNPGCVFKIKGYENPMELWMELNQPEPADIYIMDIDMPGLGGIDLAKKIREEQPKAIIIFLTSHLEYATEVYKIDALRYIYKPRMREELPEALTAAVQVFEREQKRITLRVDDGSVRIPIGQIIYVCRDKRKIDIHTAVPSALEKPTSLYDGIYTSPIGIGEFFDQLNSERFFFIDRGTFVNLDYVVGIGKDETYIQDKGKEVHLPTSRRRMLILKQALASRWRS